MMKKFAVPLLNILLISCAFICSVLSVSLMYINGTFDLSVVTAGLLTTAFGCCVFCFSTTIIPHVQLFFTGLLVTSTSCLYHVAFAAGKPELIDEFWPLTCIMGGLFLLLTCFYKHRRLRTVYVFPAILLVFLGSVFLSFSSSIIKVSFSAFVGHWWFVFFLIAALLVIIIFLYQRVPHNNFPYDKDLLEDLTDETDAETGVNEE